MKTTKSIYNGITNQVRLVLLSCAVLLFVFISSTVFGQELKKAEVKLKSGLVIKGEILKINALESVVIRITGSDSMVIPWEGIEELDFSPEVSYVNVGKRLPKVHHSFSDSSLYGSLRVGARGAEGRWNVVLNPQLSGSVGYHFNRHLGVGISAGTEQHWNPYMTVMPLGAEVRGRLKEGHVSPFYSLRLGYPRAKFSSGNDPGESIRGKYFTNPSFGVLIKPNANIAWQVSLDYMMISTHEELNEWTWSGGVSTPVLIKRDRIISSIGLTFGLYFD